MNALQSNPLLHSSVVWDTEKKLMYFDIKPQSIGDNCRMIVTRNGKGNIEMFIQPQKKKEIPRS